MTSGVTELTMAGMIRKETKTTSRWIQPQIARPVAVRAGFLASTVSVKLAIHGAKAMPSPSDSPASMSAIV